MSETRVSVILGGTRGIGAAIARKLATPGSTLVLNHLQNGKVGAAIADELEANGCRVLRVMGNIADKETRQAILAKVDEAGGQCHNLVHSVAVTSFKPLSRIRANQWDLVLAVSAGSLVAMTAALATPLTRTKGSVVAISSQGSVRHIPDYGALGPAKAALESCVRELAVEYAAQGIRVNAVRAGLVESEVMDFLPTNLVQAVAVHTPLGRLGTPAEIADVAVFLLEQGARWITGQTVVVDGGFSVT